MTERQVLVVLHEPQAGGAVLSVLRAVPELERMGWRFAFWAPKPSPLHDRLAAERRDVDGAPRYIDHSLRALRLPPGPRRRMASVPRYLRRFRRFVRERAPALVHANSILTLTEGVAASRLGLPVLLHVHEMVPGGVRGRLARRLAWSRLDGVVAVSDACGRTMTWDGRRPRIVHEAAPIPDKPVAIRSQPRPFTVGTVGVVSQRKGTDLFVDAAARVSERAPEIRFELIGGGADERDRRWIEATLARARAAGVAYAPRADVLSRMHEWDAFALPSRADPFPISMLEAMASGLPVIGTRVDGIAEQVTPDCGVLVPPDDPVALSDAVIRLASESGATREEMGRAARRRVSERFSIEVQARGLDVAYRAALATGNPSR